MNRSKSIRVIRVTMSTAKARKIMKTVSGPVSDYAADPLLQDVYLRGVRDVIGKGLGYSFRRAILSGDKRQVARFCSDGWRELGGSPADYRLRPDLTGALVELKRLCDKALRATEDAGEGPQPGFRAPSAPVDLNDECL